MPTYDYECDACGHTWELFQAITADPVTKCPDCGKKARRLFGTGAALMFKGSGFYETDYRSDSYRKSKQADEKSRDSSSSPSPDSKADSSSPSAEKSTPTTEKSTSAEPKSDSSSSREGPTSRSSSSRGSSAARKSQSESQARKGKKKG